MSRDKLTEQERAFSGAVRESLHETLSIAMSVAGKQGIDHGTALTIAHRECSLMALGLLGSLMTGQKDAQASNDLLFMAQTRYQLDMEVMVTSFEKVTGREIRREFTGSVHHA
jgi:hypothetical protein